MKIKAKDKVKILSGKDRGKVGVVSRVDVAGRTVVVEGVNIVKKHQKSTPQGKKGGIFSMEKPISASSVMLLCPKCEKPARVGFVLISKKKYRKCMKCKETF